MVLTLVVGRLVLDASKRPAPPMPTEPMEEPSAPMEAPSTEGDAEEPGGGDV
jgi:hypothetical protein